MSPRGVCFPKNAPLSFFRNTKSAVHVPYAGWLILSYSTLARTLDFPEFFVINPGVLLQDLHYAFIRCLISLLVCAVLHVITFAPFFISSPGCAHLSPTTCQPLFMFWHLIFCCPSSSWYYIFHNIIKCRMTILIIQFPGITARIFPREDCLIRPLAPLFA